MQAEPDAIQKGPKGKGKGGTKRRRAETAKTPQQTSPAKRGRKPRTAQDAGTGTPVPQTPGSEASTAESRATKEQERLHNRTAEWLGFLTINNVMLGKTSKTDLYQCKRHKKVCDEKNMHTDAVSLEARLKVMNAASMLTLPEMPKIPVEQLLVS